MSRQLANLQPIDPKLRLEAESGREALAEYRQRLTERAQRVSRMNDEDLRREAMRAANERDANALWALTEAYIVTKGRKKANTSLTTLDTYEVGVRRLLRHFEGENLLRPSRDAGERFVQDLQVGKHGDRPLEAGTIQVRLAAARALYRALRWAGATEAVPFEDVAAPEDSTAPEDKRMAYSDDEIQALLQHANEIDTVIVLLGADAGLRASEMLALRWTDVNFSAGTIQVKNGKGGKQRLVETGDDLLDALRAWRSLHTKERVMPFTTTAAARIRLRNLCKASAVQYLGVHSLRHTCGTWLAENSERGIRDAQKQLGHSSSSTTEIYAKMNRESLKAAMKRRKRVLSGSTGSAA